MFFNNWKVNLRRLYTTFYFWLSWYLLLSLAVFGQRQSLPLIPQQQAQERAYLEYDYGDEAVDQYDNSGRVRGGQPRPPVRSQPPPLNYYQTDCKAKERTLPHEKYCDLFYQLNGCTGSDDQAIQRSCPNGLIYTGNGRHGLIGVCDYPHRADCNGKEHYSKSLTLFQPRFPVREQ